MTENTLAHLLYAVLGLLVTVLFVISWREIGVSVSCLTGQGVL